MKKELENIDNRNFVRTNKLVNGRVKLKAKSYDLIRNISTLVSPTDTDFWTYEVEVAKLGIDYKRAKEYIRDIMRNPIEIKDDVKQTFDCYSWCSSMKYKNGFITFKLDPEMKEFMLQIKGNFTKTFEKYILPMESIYAKRIYEMLYQVKDFGYRKFNLEELQEILDVPKSLIPYFNFKARVLLIAIKEINKHTDIYIPVNTDNLKDVSWIRLQCGKTRKITHLNFEFRLKSDKGLFSEPKNKEPYSRFVIDKIYIDKIENELNYQDVEIFKEQEIFLDFCKKNKKAYKDMSKSLYIHLKKKRELGL